MCKIKDLVKALAAGGLNAALLTDETSVRYVLGMDISDAYVMIVEDRSYLLTDFRYYEAAINTVDAHFEIVTPSSKLDFICKAIIDAGIGALGFEADHVSYALYSSISQSLAQVDLCDVSPILTMLRSVKTADEIEFIQAAQDIADRAFSELLGVINPNMTEVEVAAELEYLMRKSGSEAPAFQTIAVSGSASALPHGVPRNVKLNPGFLTLDFGAKKNGYCSDMTRTIVIGRADSQMRDVYLTVREAQMAALEYLQHGRDCAEADSRARCIIDRKYKDSFGHSLGHGVGLYVHESPSLSPRSVGKLLVPGNVVTVEPGIYLFGKYGCRIEDMVQILDSGIRNFTHSTKELLEIF